MEKKLRKNEEFRARLGSRLEEKMITKVSVKRSQPCKKKVTSFRPKRFFTSGKISLAPCHPGMPRYLDRRCINVGFMKKTCVGSGKAPTLTNDVKPIQKLSLSALNPTYKRPSTKTINLFDRRREHEYAVTGSIQSTAEHTSSTNCNFMSKRVCSTRSISSANSWSPFLECLNLPVASRHNIMCDAGNTKMITVGKGTFGSVLFCQRKCVLSKAIPEVSSLEEARSPEERSETCYCVKRIAKTKQSWIMRKQIEREIQIHSRLDHFAIIKFLGYYESEKNIDFALEFAMYSDLFHFINTYRPQNGLPVLLSHREASNYIDQILQAMNYLHQRYIFHRDIKMENILVTSIDGDENRREQKLQLKLCDFGWAIHCSSSNELWRTTFCGTPEYLAPELVESYHITRTKFSTEDRPKLLNGRGNFQRLRSKCPKYDVRFPDIWAVGVLTYELLRGANPFNSHSIGEEKKAMKGDDQTSTTTSKEVIFDKIRKVDDFIEVKVTQDSREERLMCNFVAKLTRKNPEQRISFENALGQKWITSFK